MANLTPQEKEFWDNFETNFPAYADCKEGFMKQQAEEKELEDELESLFSILGLED